MAAVFSEQYSHELSAELKVGQSLVKSEGAGGCGAEQGSLEMNIGSGTKEECLLAHYVNVHG